MKGRANPPRARRVIEELAVDGSTREGLHEFHWGNYLDELWAIDRGEAYGVLPADWNDGSGADRLFALANTLHSVHGLTDEEGVLVEAYEYDAYGRATVRRPGGSASAVAFDGSDDVVAGGASAWGNPFGYTGQRFDAETGLMYYKNRYYHPELGRFVSRDPLGAVLPEFIFRSDMGSLYGFVVCNPVKWIDPFGLAGGDPNPYSGQDCRRLSGYDRCACGIWLGFERMVKDLEDQARQWRRNDGGGVSFWSAEGARTTPPNQSYAVVFHNCTMEARQRDDVVQCFYDCLLPRCPEDLTKDKVKDWLAETGGAITKFAGKLISVAGDAACLTGCGILRDRHRDTCLERMGTQNNGRNYHETGDLSRSSAMNDYIDRQRALLEQKRDENLLKCAGWFP